ncbi:ATP-dependent DNA helicase RecG [Plantibacter flavus]|uniref:ATP-dependent DNA helicase RecG n=1 Tax=Plantibacter flavus TaxID=150123 RepID=UPI003F15BDD5
MTGIDLGTKLGGVLGGRTATALHRAFGIDTVGDLLEHYPRRYARRGELTVLGQLPLGEDVTIVADVLEVRERSMKQRRGSILEVVISDGQGRLNLTFFNQPWRANELKPGLRGIFAGKVGDYRGSYQLAHPAYELFPDHADAPELADAEAKRWSEAPIPIYPATSTIASWQLQQSVDLVLDALPPLDDPVPFAVRSARGELGFDAALRAVHRPEVDRDWQRGRRSLRYQEAYLLQTALLQQRASSRSLPAEPRVPKPGGFLDRLDAALPFELTGDQQLVGAEIAADIAEPTPMNRLVQGEVGSGKTLVALRAMAAVADSGGQSALLAPTEVLAAQHLRSIVKSLGPDLSASLMPTLLTGQLPAADRKRALLRIVAGQARIVIGTHALLGDAVTFADLGLVVVDEQHRFGVEQRDQLRQKGHTPPHVLVLTATPIPRTVAMTVFGDLDVSTIKELPRGRQGIESFVVPLVDHPGWISRVWERLAEELAQGRQGFVVCPAIDAKEVEPGEELEEGEDTARPIASVLTTVEQLRSHPLLAERRIEVLHGRMSADEKDQTMRAFAAGEIDVLVATTVIEVGVDVPNASTMVVLDADRFGVSQLHQLRGRVGRGGVPGLCLLVTSSEAESTARERVDAVAATLDGFDLAQVDLELRREGDVLGSLQSGGRSSLKLLRVAHDGEIITEARADAARLLATDPDLTDHPVLAEALQRRLDESDRAALAKN